MGFGGLDHIGFTVADLNRSVLWYTTFLDEEPVLREVWDAAYLSRIVGYANCRMECAFWRLPGGAILELMQYLEPPSDRVDMETYNVGNAHLCLISQDIHADFDRLRGWAEFRDPIPVEIPWGPYEGGFTGYLRDPDGITIELMQLPPGGIDI